MIAAIDRSGSKSGSNGACPPLAKDAAGCNVPAEARIMRKLIGIAAAGALLAGQPVQAACIDEPVRMAARLHEFEFMMQSVMLRCSRIGVPMQEHFDQLVSAQRARFDEAFGTLQRYFTEKHGPQKAHNGSLELLSTTIANKYGGGNTNRVACNQFDSILAKASLKPSGSVDLLAVFATGMIAKPTLEERFCPAGQP